VVIQAVGRVRPFTKCREIITFQVGDLPDVRHTRQFRTLAEARSYFNFPTRRVSAAEANAAKARRYKSMGLSNSKIAGRLNVSRSTVKRYLRWGGARNLN
jgi:DNA invertase Pin-like site-specific DNA recombinase